MAVPSRTQSLAKRPSKYFPAARWDSTPNLLHVFTLIRPSATFSLREKELFGSNRVDSRAFAV